MIDGLLYDNLHFCEWGGKSRVNYYIICKWLVVKGLMPLTMLIQFNYQIVVLYFVCPYYTTYDACGRWPFKRDLGKKKKSNVINHIFLQ